MTTELEVLGTLYPATKLATLCHTRYRAGSQQFMGHVLCFAAVGSLVISSKIYALSKPLCVLPCTLSLQFCGELRNTWRQLLFVFINESIFAERKSWRNVLISIMTVM